MIMMMAGDQHCCKSDHRRACTHNDSRPTTLSLIRTSATPLQPQLLMSFNFCRPFFSGGEKAGEEGCSPYSSETGGPNYIIVGEDIGLSSALPKDVLDFRYFEPRASQMRLRSKIEAKFRTFHPRKN